MGVKTSTYTIEGRYIPTIELRAEGARFGFTFGLSKARLIVENIDEIKKFVEDNISPA